MCSAMNALATWLDVEIRIWSVREGCEALTRALGFAFNALFQITGKSPANQALSSKALMTESVTYETL